MDAVLAHYKSTGFRQKDSTISAANSIVDFIINKFNSQVSIFKSSDADQFIKPTRKRGHYNKFRAKQPSKQAKKNRHFQSSRPTDRLPIGGSAEAMSDGRRYAANPTSAEFSNLMNSHGEFHAKNCGLSLSIATAVEGSAHSFHEHESCYDL